MYKRQDQEQNRHDMLCYTLENEILSLHRQGEAVTESGLGSFCADLLEPAEGGTAQLAALYHTCLLYTSRCV